MITLRKTTLAVAAAALLMPAAISPAQAADKPNLIVLGEDADTDTVPRDSRVFKAVVDALSNQLHMSGYDVYDETTLTLDDFKQDRVRRSDQEIIDIARSIRQAPIDIAAIFTIYAGDKKLPHMTKLQTRIAGRLLEVNTGRRLGSFDVESPQSWAAPAKCSRECILETLAEHSQELSLMLGNVLVAKLDDVVLADSSGGTGAATPDGLLPYVTHYVLTFRNFTQEEMLDWEQYLNIFSGYKTHRPMEDTGLTHRVWYESQIGAAKLRRNLVRAASRLDYHVMVTAEGNEYTVEKIAGRRKLGETDDWKW